MRLLNVRTYELKPFDGSYELDYAILSHTWGQEEILFEDLCPTIRPQLNRKAGWAKVRGTCEQAKLDGYNYVWIDTCCIDKSSSAELSEAINSMFNWYREAAVCYAYLADVGPGLLQTFRNSRWFTRGWTLQELIAPKVLRFYSRDWSCIGSREDKALVISGFTNIAYAVLTQKDADREFPDLLSKYSAAERFSWAYGRQTTRKEDIAYCLLGLFGINMPLLYGEGENAFARLQEEIVKKDHDHSILAFAHKREQVNGGLRVFATSPDCFPRNIVQGAEPGLTLRMTSQSGRIQLDLLVCPCRIISGDASEEEQHRKQRSFALGLLDAAFRGDPLSRPAIILQQRRHSANLTYTRIMESAVLKVSRTPNRAADGRLVRGGPERAVISTPTVSWNVTYNLADAKRQFVTLRPGRLARALDNERREWIEVVHGPTSNQTSKLILESSFPKAAPTERPFVHALYCSDATPRSDFVPGAIWVRQGAVLFRTIIGEHKFAVHWLLEDSEATCRIDKYSATKSRWGYDRDLRLLVEKNFGLLDATSSRARLILRGPDHPAMLVTARFEKIMFLERKMYELWVECQTVTEQEAIATADAEGLASEPKGNSSLPVHERK